MEGAAIADHDPTLRSSPTTGGVAAAVSFPVSRRTTLRLEGDLPWWHSHGFAGESRVADHIQTYAIRERDRAPSTSMMVGFELPSRRRLQISLLVGGTVTNRMSHASGLVEYRDFSGAVTRHYDVGRRSSGYHWFAVSGGADAAFRITRRLAIVPQVRLHSCLYSDYTSLWFLGPRLAVRWYF